MQGLEAKAAEEFLNATLTGDATLMAAVPGGVWNIQADQPTVYPFVTFQFMSGVPYSAVGAFRIWASMIYLVKVIGESANFDDLDIAAARIDALLHRASGTVTDGVVWSCTQEATIREPDAIAGKQFRVAGGRYRLYAA